jgi:hypothetical protein
VYPEAPAMKGFLSSSPMKVVFTLAIAITPRAYSGSPHRIEEKRGAGQALWPPKRLPETPETDAFDETAGNCVC